MKIGASLRERQKVDRATAIVAAAAIEFGAHGFDDARIEDIAARAGVAPATVYNYFGDKDGILVALFGDRLRLRAELLIETARTPCDDLLEALDHFLDAVVGIIHPSSNSDLYRQAYAASFRREPGLLGAFVVDNDRGVHEALVQLFDRFQAAKKVPAHATPNDLADVVFSIGTFHWMRWVNGEVPTVVAVSSEMKRQCRLAVAGMCGVNPARPTSA